MASGSLRPTSGGTRDDRALERDFLSNEVEGGATRRRLRPHPGPFPLAGEGVKQGGGKLFDFGTWVIPLCRPS